MTNEETFLVALGTFVEVAERAELDSSLDRDAQEYAARIRGFRVLVPVVGSFNAGKTSLINAYLGRKEGRGLPTDIVPQTALATEVHPATDDRSEAVELVDGNDQIVERLALHEFGDFERQALTDPREDAEYARAHIKTDTLSPESRVVLVDMPGLDSGLRNHNMAIQRYLPLGSHFMLVVDIERGSLRESEVLQLREFLEREVEFTVLANKVDRKQTERSAVVARIAQQVRDVFGRQAPVHPVSARNDEIAPFAMAFRAIKPDVALRNYWREPLLHLFDKAITSLHTRYSAINVSSAEAESVVQELERERMDLEAKFLEDERDIRGRYSERATDRIVRYVRNEIRGSADSLATAYESGGTVAFEEHLNELVRSTLNRALRSAGTETQRDIAERYRANVEGLDARLRRLVGHEPEAGSTPLGDVGHAAAEVSSRAFGDVARRFNAVNWKSFTSVVAGVSGMLAKLVPVLLDFVLKLLPWITDMLRHQREQEREEARRTQLRAQIGNVVAPKVASEIRSAVEEEYARVAAELLSGLRTDTEEQIARIQADIRKSRADIEAGQQEAETQRETLAEDTRKLTDAKRRIENA